MARPQAGGQCRKHPHRGSRMEGRRRCGVFLHFRITISETLIVGVVVQPKRKLFRAQRGNCARPGRGGAQRPKSETTESGERMQLKASTDYGIRTILYLAAEKDVRSSKEIAREMSIPRDYLIQLAQLLRNAASSRRSRASTVGTLLRATHPISRFSRSSPLWKMPSK